jgi:hypothetical protein
MSVIEDDDPESQAFKRKTLLNDARVHEQQQSVRNGDTSAYINHYSPELGGRFSNVGAASVVRTTPNPYPPLPENNPWRSDPVPDEPPLGFEINRLSAYELEPSINPADPEPSPCTPAQQTGGAESAPSDPGLSEHPAPPSSSEDDDNA